MHKEVLQIILKKAEVSPTQLPWLENIKSYPLSVEAFANINLDQAGNPELQPNEEGLYPANIFVLQRHGTGLDPNQGDIFTKVATGIDICDYPSATEVDKLNTFETDTKEGYAYYRINTVTLYTDSAEAADNLWTNLKEDCQYLVRDINALNTLNTEAENVIVTIAAITQTDIIEKKD